MKRNHPFTPAFLLVALSVLASLGSAVDKKTALEIDARIVKYGPEIIRIRRDLHMNPELSGQEVKTAGLLSATLRALGLEIKTQVAKTGVVGLLRGAADGPTIAVRADMDALPIEELTGLDFKSLNKGVMHACGHDVHMSVVLGTAYVLSGLRDRIRGNIKFIFQPAEEGLPSGEEGGAALMIKEGVLENPSVRAIFGLHVWPETSGEVYFTAGSIMANSDSFKVTVKGKNAHGARPHEGVDSIVLASQIVLALQSIISREIDPTDPAVLTIGKINGGSRSNIIAEQTVLEGTVRTLSDRNRTQIPLLMESIVKNIATFHGGAYDFTYNKSNPAVTNNPDLAKRMLPTIKNLLGENRVHDIKPQFVSEDFAYYGQKVPGFFFFLGVNSPNTADSPPLHSPNFSPDEQSIPVGIRVMTHLLFDALENQVLIDGQRPKR